MNVCLFSLHAVKDIFLECERSISLARLGEPTNSRTGCFLLDNLQEIWLYILEVRRIEEAILPRLIYVSKAKIDISANKALNVAPIQRRRQSHVSL